MFYDFVVKCCVRCFLFSLLCLCSKSVCSGGYLYMVFVMSEDVMNVSVNSVICGYFIVVFGLCVCVCVGCVCVGVW